jgi:hypothetical protein
LTHYAVTIAATGDAAPCRPEANVPGRRSAERGWECPRQRLALQIRLGAGMAHRRVETCVTGHWLQRLAAAVAEDELVRLLRGIRRDCSVRPDQLREQVRRLVALAARWAGATTGPRARIASPSCPCSHLCHFCWPASVSWAGAEFAVMAASPACCCHTAGCFDPPMSGIMSGRCMTNPSMFPATTGS